MVFVRTVSASILFLARPGQKAPFIEILVAFCKSVSGLVVQSRPFSDER